MAQNVSDRVQTGPEVDLNEQGWPVLHAADACDGRSAVGQPCVLGYHKGHHRDALGVEWLSED
ncbi:hypothetical protein [Kribbella sp. NPDC051718]|uniref:hypothetical protein n=1 Tax=Kribbella sp. NPDC051718 TaxID=3155168 RepID=UPI0034321CDD